MYLGAYSTANALQHYQNNSVMMARPIELVIMLYEGMLKKMKLAKLYIGDGEMEMAHKSLCGAQDIVCELLHSLDLHYEVSGSLMKLYDYMLHELTEANMEKTTERIDALIPVVEELRDAWQSIRNESGHVYTIEE